MCFGCAGVGWLQRSNYCSRIASASSGINVKKRLKDKGKGGGRGKGPRTDWRSRHRMRVPHACKVSGVLARAAQGEGEEQEDVEQKRRGGGRQGAMEKAKEKDTMKAARRIPRRRSRKD